MLATKLALVRRLALGSSLLLAFACGSDPGTDDTSDGGAPGTGGAGTGGNAGGNPAIGGGGGTGGAGDLPSPYSACYPFDQPQTRELRAAPKKVLAFYYPMFPISIDNADPSMDFWNRWMDPAGGNGEYGSIGGLMRDRPLPRAPWDDEAWRQRDFETEIRRAIAVGLDGFIYEHPDHVAQDPRNNQLPTMLDAAAAVDPDFKIMLSPDFPGGEGASTDGLVETIGNAASHPSVYRLDDGRIPLASFAPQRQPVSFWIEVRDRLAAEKGVDVTFWPFLAPTPPNDTVYEEWNDLVDTYSSWGGRTVGAAEQQRLWSLEAHSRDRGWMSPVAFEDVRHKIGNTPDEGRWYAEASNSGALRAQFEKAIEGEADAVALLTWTDYTESWMNVSQERGYAIPDLVAYYTVWLKTGEQPPVVRDSLYYFHRNQHTDAPYDTGLQTEGPMELKHSGPAENQVELLAFLTEPGELVITQGDDVQTMDAPAGMTSFRAPLVAGTTPSFELRREGAVVRQLTSNTAIRSTVDYQDMMYHAGGGLDCERPD